MKLFKVEHTYTWVSYEVAEAKTDAHRLACEKHHIVVNPATSHKKITEVTEYGEEITKEERPA